MLLYVVIVFGVVVVFQLSGISQRLSDMTLTLRGLEKELQWHTDYTFAHHLKKCLEGIPKDIIEELGWYGDYTFAHHLREQLQAIEQNTSSVVEKLQDIEQNTQAIEQNTSSLG